MNQVKEKYHVVRCQNPQVAADYVIPCPEECRETYGTPVHLLPQSPVRVFPKLKIACTNFVGSANLMDLEKAGKVKWKTLEEGIDVAMVEGVEV